MTVDYSQNQTKTIDWAALHRDVALLARQLKGKGPFLGIVAIARGGLVPAALLARMLDLRVIDTVCISSYDDKKQRESEPLLLKGVSGEISEGGAGWLVVDDLADSGNTMRTVRALLPQAHIATIYAKPNGAPMVDSLAVAVDQSVWLVFPWDLDP
jgi:xanthine phosphoribosyltransferase